MKIYLLGVSRRFGKSQKTGRDYDIARINAITEQRSNNGQNSTFQASGFREMEIELDPTSINEFLGLKYPAEYEVETDSRPGQNGLVTVVTGLKK